MTNRILLVTNSRFPPGEKFLLGREPGRLRRCAPQMA